MKTKSKIMCGVGYLISGISFVYAGISKDRNALGLGASFFTMTYTAHKIGKNNELENLLN